MYKKNTYYILILIDIYFIIINFGKIFSLYLTTNSINLKLKMNFTIHCCFNILQVKEIYLMILNFNLRGLVIQVYNFNTLIISFDYHFSLIL